MITDSDLKHLSAMEFKLKYGSRDSFSFKFQMICVLYCCTLMILLVVQCAYFVFIYFCLIFLSVHEHARVRLKNKVSASSAIEGEWIFAYFTATPLQTPTIWIVNHIEFIDVNLRLTAAYSQTHLVWGFFFSCVREIWAVLFVLLFLHIRAKKTFTMALYGK